MDKQIQQSVAEINELNKQVQSQTQENQSLLFSRVKQEGRLKEARSQEEG